MLLTDGLPEVFVANDFSKLLKTNGKPLRETVFPLLRNLGVRINNVAGDEVER